VRRKGINAVANATNLPFINEGVDLVLCENVLEHLPEPALALNQFWRVLRKGGRLLLVTPFLFPLHDVPYDFFRYTEYALQHLLRLYSKTSLHRILLFPAFKTFFDRFVLYYVAIAEK